MSNFDLYVMISGFTGIWVTQTLGQYMLGCHTVLLSLAMGD